jgi:hypothetical protein
MTPEEKENRRLLVEAAELSGYSDREFAVKCLGRNERTFRSWKEGKPIPDAPMDLHRRLHADFSERRARKTRQGIPIEEQKRRMQASRARGHT